MCQIWACVLCENFLWKIMNIFSAMDDTSFAADSGAVFWQALNVLTLLLNIVAVEKWLCGLLALDSVEVGYLCVFVSMYPVVDHNSRCQFVPTGH